MSTLPSKWNNEAYVSLHLVQTMLEMAGLPRNSSYSHWYPEFDIFVPSTGTNKAADFLVEDFRRYVNFLVEIKSARTRINDNARFQLKMYLQHSGIRFGLLVDPFLVEIYHYNQGQCTLWDKHNIQNPTKVNPVADFLRSFLESVRMRTIAFHTSKGGVGKTTLTVNVAFELAKFGNRVLVIDLDDQANSSLYLGVNRADELDQANTVDEFDQILESFQERKEVIDFLGLDFNSPNINYKDYIKPSTFNQYIYGNGRIDVLPGSYRTRDEGLTSTLGIREKLLNKALQRSGMASDYNYVIIDTPPSSTMVAKNGLFAAQYVVIPTQMEYFSVYGIRTVTRKIQNEVQEEMNGERGRILGIVPMMTGGTKLNNLATQLIQRTLPNMKIFTEITRTVKWAEACQKYMPISVFAERDATAGAAATKSSTLAQELIAQIDQEESQRGV